MLRNHLAHANDYAASPEEAGKTCETVRLLDKWREDFSRVIRGEFKSSDEWLKYLSDGRRRDLRDELEKAEAQDGVVDALLFTQFCDSPRPKRR